MIHELEAPPPDLCVRMVEPGYQCGLRSGMYLHPPKIVGVDRPDKLDDGMIPARRVCKGLNQFRGSIHASILTPANYSSFVGGGRTEPTRLSRPESSCTRGCSVLPCRDLPWRAAA